MKVQESIGNLLIVTKTLAENQSQKRSTCHKLHFHVSNTTVCLIPFLLHTSKNDFSFHIRSHELRDLTELSYETKLIRIKQPLEDCGRNETTLRLLK